jgi:hypothetical protein
LATSDESIADYIECTLLYHTTADKNSITEWKHSALDALMKHQMIKTDNIGNFEANQIGLATVASGLGVKDGIFIHEELSKALKSFNLESEMHIIYLFTPSYGLGDVKWTVFRKEIELMNDSDMRTGLIVGLNPGLVNRMFVLHLLRILQILITPQGSRRQIQYSYT